MIASNHELSQRYNDTSVLENHHVATLFKALEMPGCQLLTQLGAEVGSRQAKGKLRKVLISCIMSTDMANHGVVLQSFVSCMAVFNKANLAHRQHVLNMLLHSADVGNPTLKFELAKKWSVCIIEEFTGQVNKETQLGLPVTEFMRISGDILKIRNNQTGFIDVLVLPLFKAIDLHMPELKGYTRTAEENREIWKEITAL